MKIYSKLAELKKEIGSVSKDSTNPFFKSKYFDINGLLEHLEPLLSKHKLIVLQPIIDGKVTSQIIDPETGEMVTSELELGNISDPQKKGSEITYYRRYTLASLLGIQAEDDDGNRASKPSPKLTESQINVVISKVKACNDLQTLTKIYNSDQRFKTTKEVVEAIREKNRELKDK